MQVSKLTSQFQVMLSQEPQHHIRFAIERRLRLSEVAQKCGGTIQFAAAAAATVDDYMKWASEELNKDDGETTKVALFQPLRAILMCLLLLLTVLSGCYHKVFK
jgi:hypothetical protein